MKKATQAIVAEAKAEIKEERKRGAVMTAKEILLQIEAMEESLAELRKQLDELEVL